MSTALTLGSRAASRLDLSLCLVDFFRPLLGGEVLEARPEARSIGGEQELYFSPRDVGFLRGGVRGTSACPPVLPLALLPPIDPIEWPLPAQHPVLDAQLAHEAHAGARPPSPLPIPAALSRRDRQLDPCSGGIGEMSKWASSTRNESKSSTESLGERGILKSFRR